MILSGTPGRWHLPLMVTKILQTLPGVPTLWDGAGHGQHGEVRLLQPPEESGARNSS